MPENVVKEAPSRVKLMAAFAAVYLIWGSTYLAIRYGLETLPPFLMAGTRFLVAGALLYAWARLREAPRPERKYWGPAAVIGGLLLLGGNGLVVWAEQRVPSGLAALLVATEPWWIVLLNWARPGGQRPGGKVVLGLLTGFAGMLLLVGPEDLAGGGGRVDTLGGLAVIVAALSWATGSIYSLRAKLPRSALMAAAMQMIAGGMLLFAAGSIAGEWAKLDIRAVSLLSAGALAYLIVFGSLVAYSSYGWLLRVTTPARASTYAYVNPVVAVLLGWAVAREPVSMRMLIAAAVIVASVVLINTYRRPDRVDARPGIGKGGHERALRLEASESPNA